MLKKFNIHLQHFLPQHGLSSLAGKLAEARSPWLKNLLIKQFIRSFNVDMSSAEIEDAHAYATFNDFFTRKLKANLRPIAPDLASPVDGTLSQFGSINKNQLIQAKNFNYTLETLLAQDTQLVKAFNDGSFATFYLAPHNYHRVHMPLAGKLTQTIYVPGKLFSVNDTSSQMIPELYAQNERLVSIFDTDIGPMAIILVGAIIVGSIQMTWQQKPHRGRNVSVQNFGDAVFAKGAEMGLFKLGSTVITLFPKDKIAWLPTIKPGIEVQYGMPMGRIKNP